jgi:kynureninase
VVFRSSQLLDIPSLCKKARQKKIIIGFDCSHSVGAIPHFFDKWGVDFGMWCSYKYLNGGPGSSVFLYLNKKHFKKEPLLAGWFGNKKEEQFKFSLDFNPAKNAGGWQISSPSILSAAAVEGALEVTLEAGIHNIREKSKNLTSYLIFLVESILSDPPYSFKIFSPPGSKLPRRTCSHKSG